MKNRLRLYTGLLLLAALPACSTTPIPPDMSGATLTPRTSSYVDLTSLPAPRGQIVASVYNFRDQTGQYKAAPASSFSTAVTQGASALLTKSLHDSGWFITLEREGLQNLLTERKIIRAAQNKPDIPANNSDDLPSLLAANVLLEGSVVSYDTNLRTGGAGARYFGIGTDEQYREDQVTINLRSIDIRTGRILTNVMTSKKILSLEVNAGVFRFVEYKRLLELESGVTTNEPRQMCVQSAIEAAVIHTIAEGIKNRSWALLDEQAINHSVLSRYLNEQPVVFEYPGYPEKTGDKNHDPS